MLYSLGAKLTGEAKIDEESKIIFEARKGLIDNYHKYKQIGKSNVPQVRTHLRQYNSTGYNITLFTITNIKKI